MRAMVLHEPGPVEENPLKCEDIPAPIPGPGQVRIKVRCCGVCRTDLHIVEGELRTRELPIVPGHQVVGTVDAVGPLAGSALPEGAGCLRPGQLVGLPWLHYACGTCEFCRQGNENLCENIKFTGFDVNGGFAQYVLAPTEFVVRVPSGFRPEDAAPLLCAGIIGYRSLKIAGVEPGDTVALFGFGASAHLAVQVAVYWGCRVLVFTRSQKHRELALTLGASWAGAPGDTPPARYRRAIIFAPAGSLIPQALSGLSRGGTLAINAVHMDGIPPMDYSYLYWEKKIQSVANATRQDAAEFLEIAAKIPVRVSREIYALEDANLALQRLKAGLVQGEAVLVI